MMYMIVAVCSLAIIVARRYFNMFGKAELGGPTTSKYISTTALVSLYGLFLVVISLKAYGIIANPFSLV